MIFKVQYNNINIFTVWRRDQSAAIQNIKSWIFLIDYKIGFIFNDFYSLIR